MTPVAETPRIYALPEFAFEDITAAYRGRSGTCYCGCAGTYFHREGTEAEVQKSQGYAADPKQFSDRGVRTRLNKVRRLAPEYGLEVIDLEGSKEIIYTLEVDDIDTTIYVRKPVA